MINDESLMEFFLPRDTLTRNTLKTIATTSHLSKAKNLP